MRPMRNVVRILQTKKTQRLLKSSGCKRMLRGTSILTRLDKSWRLLRMSSDSMKPVEESITKKLTERLAPQHLEVINESYMHNVPKGSETHFKVVVISDKFQSVALIKRHRMVNEVLQEELNSGVHALSILAKTPQQWEDSAQNVGKSPPCRGGAGL
ncbi:bolA-like protein DDB_G0274169 [Mizuhopecten yessoensis]|uniref:bolA-like protein DDB_G0274169 n=1 Tax=Mizuhopecten yessoensis TaxID=6573 RepID=UPI000B45DBAC|nr:bolA-like protein DDB_G0274169 [Mizuhopecten yessoensis]